MSETKICSSGDVDYNILPQETKDRIQNDINENKGGVQYVALKQKDGSLGHLFRVDDKVWEMIKPNKYDKFLMSTDLLRERLKAINDSKMLSKETK